MSVHAKLLSSFDLLFGKRCSKFEIRIKFTHIIHKNMSIYMRFLWPFVCRGKVSLLSKGVSEDIRQKGVCEPNDLEPIQWNEIHAANGESPLANQRTAQNHY